jgi:hypothetical protein
MTVGPFAFYTPIDGGTSSLPFCAFVTDAGPPMPDFTAASLPGKELRLSRNWYSIEVTVHAGSDEGISGGIGPRRNSPVLDDLHARHLREVDFRLKTGRGERRQRLPRRHGDDKRPRDFGAAPAMKPQVERLSIRPLQGVADVADRDRRAPSRRVSYGREGPFFGGDLYRGYHPLPVR